MNNTCHNGQCLGLAVTSLTLPLEVSLRVCGPHTQHVPPSPFVPHRKRVMYTMFSHLWLCRSSLTLFPQQVVMVQINIVLIYHSSVIHCIIMLYYWNRHHSMRKKSNLNCKNFIYIKQFKFGMTGQGIGWINIKLLKEILTEGPDILF